MGDRALLRLQGELGSYDLMHGSDTITLSDRLKEAREAPSIIIIHITLSDRVYRMPGDRGVYAQVRLGVEGLNSTKERFLCRAP
jgi:hypothetical protein